MDREQLKTQTIETSRSIMSLARGIGSRIMDKTATLMPADRVTAERALRIKEDSGISRWQKLTAASAMLGAISGSAVVIGRRMMRPDGDLRPDLEDIMIDSSASVSGSSTTAETAASTLSSLASSTMPETDPESPNPAA